MPAGDIPHRLLRLPMTQLTVVIYVVPTQALSWRVCQHSAYGEITVSKERRTSQLMAAQCHQQALTEAKHFVQDVVLTLNA